MTEIKQSAFSIANEKPVTVVAIDDHPLIRQAIRNMLALHDEITLVAEGSAGEHLFPLVAAHRPDVLILDLGLPQTSNGSTYDQSFQVLPAVARLYQEYPETAVIILSQHIITSLVHHAAEVGVRGYLLKSDDLSLNLPDAIETVSKGGVFFSEGITQVLFIGGTPPDLILTERQREIVLAIASAPDASYAEHAAALQIAEATLSNHLARIFRKLGVRSLTACIMRCIELGIVPVEQGANPDTNG
jgi:DNA-binding NarL/FixJ family response regulator